MNFSIVKYIIGYVFVAEGAFMALPCIVALIYQEREGWSFVITGVLCLFLGGLLRRKGGCCEGESVVGAVFRVCS